MTIQTLPGAIVEGAINFVRLPADLALAVSGEGPVATSLGVAVDHTDAAVRDVAGTVLRDEHLKRQADRRRQAAAQRRRRRRRREDGAPAWDEGTVKAEAEVASVESG